MGGLWAEARLLPASLGGLWVRPVCWHGSVQVELLAGCAFPPDVTGCLSSVWFSCISEEEHLFFP